MLLKDISRHESEGIGKAKKLKGDLSGFCSRRIDDENRLIYRVSDDSIEIISCRGHYADK